MPAPALLGTISEILSRGGLLAAISEFNVARAAKVPVLEAFSLRFPDLSRRELGALRLLAEDAITAGQRAARGEGQRAIDDFTQRVPFTLGNYRGEPIAGQVGWSIENPFGGEMIGGVAELRPGQTLEELRSELFELATQIVGLYPERFMPDREDGASPRTIRGELRGEEIRFTSLIIGQ